MPITALGFLAVFGVGCIATLKKPFAGIFLYFFVFYMHPPGKYWGAYLPEMRWTLIVAVLTLISVFINEKDKGEWIKFKETKLFIAFACFVGLQFPFVLSAEWHKIYFILLIKLLILYFLLVTIVNSKEKIVMVIITNLIGCAYIGFTALQNHGGGRFEKAGLPSINDSNLLAIHVIPILIAGAFLFLSDSVKKKYWLLIPLAFSGNLIIMTGSRGAIAALAVTLVIIFVLSAKEFKGRLLKWGAIALISLSFVSLDFIVSRIETVTQSEEIEGSEQDKSAESRMIIINAQIEMFKESPLIGMGHRTTLLLSPLYIDHKYLTKTAAGGLRGSHNITMSFLADHGLVGSSLFFLIITMSSLGAFAMARKQYIDKDIRLIAIGLGGGLIGIMVASQFSNSKVLEVTVWMVAFIVILKSLTLDVKSNAR